MNYSDWISTSACPNYDNSDYTVPLPIILSSSTFGWKRCYNIDTINNGKEFSSASDNSEIDDFLYNTETV